MVLKYDDESVCPKFIRESDGIFSWCNWFRLKPISVIDESYIGQIIRVRTEKDTPYFERELLAITTLCEFVCWNLEKTDTVILKFAEPVPKFRKDEWVRSKENRKYIIRANDAKIENDFEKWTPEENELCVFWNKYAKTELFVIGRVSYSEDDECHCFGMTSSRDGTTPISYLDKIKGKA